MFGRDTLGVWIGVVVLSGMFLTGQDTWGPPPPPPPPASTLPHTGITRCYDMTGEIECPLPGEPFYGQDAQYVINPMSYTCNGNGTVTDNVTGLVWQKCSAGLSGDDCSEGTAAFMNWGKAVATCEDSTLAGYTDWRLPGEFDLQSIVNYGRYSPAIDTGAFPGTILSRYWAWTTYACYVGGGHFFIGGVYGRYITSTDYVRCVRREETSMSFTDNGDGTVTHNETGLTWQQQGDHVARNWQSALAYCQDLSLGGATDWRLPNIKELRSIADTARYNPAIDTAVFPGTEGARYWSSSTYSQYLPDAWFVSFYHGNVGGHGKANAYDVRCVR